MCEDEKNADSNIYPNLCCCIIFTVLNIFFIIVFVALYIYCKNDWEIEVFIICSIIIVVMSVLNILFCILNFLYYKERTKNHLLTEAYCVAIKKIDNRHDKKTTITPCKEYKEPKREEIEYGVKAITKIFETYCQNITAK